VTNSSRVCDLVRDAVVVLGFIESPGSLRGLRSHAVAHDRLVLVVAPDHPWARRRRPLDPTELARTPLISREEGSGTRDTAECAVRAAGAVLVPPLLELGSSTAIRSTVLAGGGAALLSELVVAQDVAGRGLVEVPTAGLDFGRALRVVWRTGTRPVGAAAALVGVALRNRRAGPRPVPG
jgi:DNA-binding transcriptional LysR family regulator